MQNTLFIGNGICVDYEKCQCNDNWIGLSCESPTCYGVNNCSLNGLCVSPNKCECFEQYDGKNCTEKVAANLNTPIFVNGSYFAVVSENQGKGYVILTVSANDSDHGRSGEISYSIEEVNIANFFIIDHESGQIAVAADNVLDYETILQKQFTFIVAATDNGIPSRRSEANVTITVKDENDNCPVFKILPGNYKIPLEIVANDDDYGDNGRIKYSITAETDPDRNFFISSNGTLLANSVLQPGAYLLTIVAQDGGVIPCARELSLTVVVDEIVSVSTSTLISSNTISTNTSSVMSISTVPVLKSSFLLKGTIDLKSFSLFQSTIIALEISSSLQTSTIAFEPSSSVHQSYAINMLSTNTAQLQPTKTGSTESPSSSTTTNNIVFVRLRLLNVGFVAGYQNKNSIDYKNLRRMVEMTVINVFETIRGFLGIFDVDFEQGSVIVNIQTEVSSENTRVSTSSLAKAVVDAGDENGRLGELHFDTAFLQEQITPTTPPTTETSNEEDDNDTFVGVGVGVGVGIGLVASICFTLVLCLVSIHF